jgi:hypothetical protein
MSSIGGMVHLLLTNTSFCTQYPIITSSIQTPTFPSRAQSDTYLQANDASANDVLSVTFRPPHAHLPITRSPSIPSPPPSYPRTVLVIRSDLGLRKSGAEGEFTLIRDGSVYGGGSEGAEERRDRSVSRILQLR